MPYPIVTLKPGKHAHLKNRHHAIFQNAVAGTPTVADGSIVEVQSSDKEFLCYAHWNSKAYICGRAIAFKKSEPMAQLKSAIESAIALREKFFRDEDTTAIRLINAEGDAVPGLIVDRYGDILTVQLTTQGMDGLRSWITDLLKKTCKPKAIFEKSAGPGRSKEGLEAVEQWLGPKGPDTVDIKERGLTYKISLMGSQKTGFFLDQREMRSLVRSLAKDKTVLDCCSYVGGFSVSALAGGAKSADAVDYDQTAIAQAKEHVKMNGFDAKKFSAYGEDVFNFLRRSPEKSYDFVILDPPAFAKRSTDLDPAKRAYTDLNRLGMQAMKQGGLLLTCSCSYQMDPQLFQTVVFHAARQANKSVRILGRHRHAFDHPVNLFHPETEYLKSLLLWVD